MTTYDYRIRKKWNIKRSKIILKIKPKQTEKYFKSLSFASSLSQPQLSVVSHLYSLWLPGILTLQVHLINLPRIVTLCDKGLRHSFYNPTISFFFSISLYILVSQNFSFTHQQDFSFLLHFVSHHIFIFWVVSLPFSG